MSRWTPEIALPWAMADLEHMLNDAFAVLAKIGVECAHPVARARLADTGAVSFSGRRIVFHKQAMREHHDCRRKEILAAPDPRAEAFALGGCQAALSYCDPETLTVRPATTVEATSMARMWDARGLSGTIPVIPGDVPPELITLAAERIALENSRFLGGALTVMDPREVRFLIDMNLAAGRRYRLVEQVGISPLRFNDRAIEVALTFAADPDVDVALDGFIPMAGATCPLDPRSAVVQAVAEALAHDFLCTTLGIAGGTLAARIEPFDFQYTTIVFGSPEWCLYRAAVVRMNEHVTGRRPSGGRFRTVAKQPDEQAACERTASVLWQALAGARHFGAVGQLSVDEVFSPQQAAIDREILGYVERVIDGLEIQAEAGDALQLIDEGVRSGHFVGIADTVDRFRAFYRFPDLFRHWSCGKWRAEGSPSILGEAWAIAQREIASSDSMLPEVALAAIAKVYMRAEEYVRRTSTGR